MHILKKLSMQKKTEEGSKQIIGGINQKQDNRLKPKHTDNHNTCKWTKPGISAKGQIANIL